MIRKNELPNYFVAGADQILSLVKIGLSPSNKNLYYMLH